jgi:hypothetical protein
MERRSVPLRLDVPMRSSSAGKSCLRFAPLSALGDKLPVCVRLNGDKKFTMIHQAKGKNV